MGSSDNLLLFKLDLLFFSVSDITVEDSFDFFAGYSSAVRATDDDDDDDDDDGVTVSFDVFTSFLFREAIPPSFSRDSFAKYISRCA